MNKLKITVKNLLDSIISNIITRIWWHLPVTRENKEHVKDVIFGSLPFLFRYTRVYRNWREAKKWTMRIDQRLALDPDVRIRKLDSDLISQLKYQPEPVSAEPVTKVAIIIHVFHFEIFTEIIELLKTNTAIKFTVFVTAPIDLCDKITKSFRKNNFDYRVMPVDNRGRDILPFLKIIPQVFSAGFQLILKIHTKKINHRRSGDSWRKDLYGKLLGEETMREIMDIFNKDHAVGLVGAKGHVVPLHLYYGANAGRVEYLSWEMGVASGELMNLNFPAGSMFWIRKQALYPLLNQNLKDDDFDEETGQVDGTLAHAVERAFAVSTHAAGFKFVDNTYDPVTPVIEVTKDHPFTR